MWPNSAILSTATCLSTSSLTMKENVLRSQEGKKARKSLKKLDVIISKRCLLRRPLLLLVCASSTVEKASHAFCKASPDDAIIINSPLSWCLFAV